MNGSARESLAVVHRLYDAWNTGDVAGAAALLAPGVRWESFRTSGHVAGPQGLEATLGGGSSGGTWSLSPVTVDLFVGVVDHVIAFSRRGSQGGPEAERLEVWTLRDGRAAHYRGFPLAEGLAVLSETTGSHRLDAVCRGVLAFNRGEVDEWAPLFDAGGLALGERLDDLAILGETANALVVSAVQLAEPLHLVIAFEGDRARAVGVHATPEAALSAARSLPRFGS